MNRRVRAEELNRFVGAQREDVADRLALEAHRKRFGAEAKSTAYLARDFDIGQETHLDALDALALAAFAAPALGVEREAACGVAAHARFVDLSEKPPDRVPETDVRRGARAWRLADWRLVDFEHAPDLLPALQVAAAENRNLFLLLVVFADTVRKIGVEHIACECRFTGARHAGDDRQPPERHAQVDDLQVVQVRANDFECRRLPADRP